MARLSTIVCIVLVTLTAAAQDPQFNLLVDVPIVSVNVQVQDPVTGHTITTLKKEDFAIYEDGRPQDIRNFSPADEPYNILVMFDCTGSIKNQWSFLRTAMDRFSEGLRPQDRISIVAFGAGTVVLRDWTRRNDLRMDFEVPTSNKVCDDTDFYQAMTWAAGRISKVDGRKGVIVFSDGVHEHIPQRRTSVGGLPLTRFIDPLDDDAFLASLRNVRDSEAIFYFVAVNTDLNPAPVNDLLHPATAYSATAVFNLQQVRLRMEMLARESGGVIVYPRGVNDYAELFERIGAELGSSYSLGYAPPDPSDLLRHRIEVRVMDKELKVRQSRDTYRIQ